MPHDVEGILVSEEFQSSQVLRFSKIYLTFFLALVHVYLINLHMIFFENVSIKAVIASLYCPVRQAVGRGRLGGLTQTWFMEQFSCELENGFG